MAKEVAKRDCPRQSDRTCVYVYIYKYTAFEYTYKLTLSGNSLLLLILVTLCHRDSRISGVTFFIVSAWYIPSFNVFEHNKMPL